MHREAIQSVIRWNFGWVRDTHVHLGVCNLQLCSHHNYYNKQKYFWNEMKCDVWLMIDNDVADKKNENKVGMSSY